MATSSTTKNFVISGKEQGEMLADAIDVSANDRPNRIPVAARQLKGKDDLMFSGTDELHELVQLLRLL